jgi:hypothetical protein
MFHLFARLGCMVPDAAFMGGLTISVHLLLERLSVRDRM